MIQENYEVCNLCETEVVLCIPGTKPGCGVYQEFLGKEEASSEKRSVTEKTADAQTKTVIANRGIMNRLAGKVVEIEEGQVMAKVTIKINEDSYISSLMPIEEFMQLRKNVGDTVGIAFKSANVKLMV